jgi:hypothetical protein
MTKYEVKAVVSDYGIYEDGELRLVINSQANALLIKYVLEQDLKHKVVIKDLLKSKNKPKRKFRAMTISEWCDPKKCPKCEYHYGAFYCDYSNFNQVNRGREKNKAYKTKDEKYILREVSE